MASSCITCQLLQWVHSESSCLGKASGLEQVGTLGWTRSSFGLGFGLKRKGHMLTHHSPGHPRSKEWATGRLEGKERLFWWGRPGWWDAGRLRLGLKCSPQGQRPQSSHGPAHPHTGNSGLRLDLLLGTCWRSSLGWGDTDSQHRGWRGAKGKDTQTRAVKTAPRVPAQTLATEDLNFMLLRDQGQGMCLGSTHTFSYSPT